MVVKWAGGLYLLYLGIKLVRAGISPIERAAQAQPGSRWRLAPMPTPTLCSDRIVTGMPARAGILQPLTKAFENWQPINKSIFPQSTDSSNPSTEIIDRK